MKVYICTDMEGISGVVLRVQGERGTQEYETASRLLLGDVNAAIDGALAGGATEIIVADAHSSGFNLPVQDLHPAAEYVMGDGSSPGKPRWPFLDGSVDAVFLVGYHAMAGTGAAVLDHTMITGTCRNCIVNGTTIGESEIDAAFAGSFGVPTVMVSGDDKVCAEVSRFIPNAITACVKRGIGRERALLKAPEKAHEIITAAARDAVRAIPSIRPFTIPGPVEITIEFGNTVFVDRIRCDGTSVIRVDARTVTFKGKDFAEAFYRAF
jgi:D-amino peptidase